MVAMSPSAAPTRYAIGVYELDTQQKIVFRDGTRVPLTPKAVDLLIVLASRAGEVISKSELMEKVWPDAIVDEGTLSKLVFNVRKELPDLQIETLPKRGYLLSIPTAPAPRARRPVNFAVLAAILVGLLALGLLFRPRGDADENTLTVMPFTAAAGTDPALARSAGDFISGRVAALGVGIKQSGGRVTLDGVVQKNGEHIEVVYRLTSVDDGLQVGGGQAESLSYTDLEGRIAEGVAALIHLRRGVRKYHDRALTSAERQQTYLRAVSLITPDSSNTEPDQAITLLQSIPDWNRSPYVLCALSRATMHKGPLEPKVWQQMVAYQQQAAKLAPDHPRVIAMRALLHKVRGELVQAEADMHAALVDEPDAADVLLDLARVYGTMSRTRDTVRTYNYLIKIHPECALCVNSFGVFELQTGRLEHARQLFERANVLDPSYPGHAVNLAAVDIRLGRLEEALPQIESAVRRQPETNSTEALAYCQLLLGDIDAAERNFRESVRLLPKNFASWEGLATALHLQHRDRESTDALKHAIGIARSIIKMDPQQHEVHAILGECLAKQGDIAAAKKEIAIALQDEDPVPDVFASAALVDLLSGDRDAAIENLRRAANKGLSPALFVRDPDLAPLRSTPQFMMWADANAISMSSLSR
ncbi:MAG TPA: tetratricopeptide repeat protein [Thermoanaerobaculia bacterium]|nr:tetratricopeptide repeat protein [Thermoanaerobaculia bacterium]